MYLIFDSNKHTGNIIDIIFSLNYQHKGCRDFADASVNTSCQDFVGLCYTLAGYQCHTWDSGCFAWVAVNSDSMVIGDNIRIAAGEEVDHSFHSLGKGTDYHMEVGSPHHNLHIHMLDSLGSRYSRVVAALAAFVAFVIQRAQP